ncbi:MAG: UvrD-helicase domain-containing protein, partial [Clostridia bacterium]|nr:UvrD-helicase domain-containing protein [Clostridia bacterium]
SGIQDRLFDLLSNGKNLFVVGDVKQSIYNFRNSNPKFFMQKYNNYSLNKEKGQKIILSENFRSSSGVIDFINNLFSEIMTERTGGVNYNDEHSLKYNNKTVKDFKVPADINIIHYDSKSIENMEDENSISDKHIAEARFIAQRIIEIVEVEKPEIYDGRIDGYRAVTYGDIAVLMRRTRGVASAFANEFISYGIPVFTQETGSYFMTVEIATVISYLKIIENPLQDVPMLAVMRSPIFGFDDNSIANLRADNPKTSLYMMLKSSDDEKAVSFIKNLDELIELEKYKSVDYIVRKIIFDTGYYQFAGNLPNGSARMANLELLCKRASDFVKKGYKSIFNFIRYINNMIENEEEYSSARLVSEGENVVNIMTIHKSKGLEFPIVFLAGCGDRFNKIDFIKPYIYDEELGMITNIVDKERRLSYKSVFQKAVILKKKEEIMSEEIRLLYVAVTRAKYKIIISAVSSKAAEKAQRCEKGIRDIYTLKNSDSYIDIILSTGNFKKINVIDSTTLKIPEKTSVKLSDESVNADYSQYYNEIDRRLKYIYPYAKSKNIPSKKSISEIVSGSDDIIHLDKIKGRDKSLSSAQKGTIVHYVLQNLNLCNVDSITSIDGQIDKMISDGMLSSDFKQYIDTDAIYGFFASDIGKRMLRSDKIYREFKFCVDVPAVDIGYDVSNETVLIQGVIDCCFYEDGEYVIIDYKTGSMQEKYKVQLELYKKCLSIATGKNVRETCIYPLI